MQEFVQETGATGEDVLELHCHASPAVLRAVLAAIPRAAMAEGMGHRIREARPGEFIMRGYHNGKLRGGIAQLEAMALLLRAETEQQRRLAARELSESRGASGPAASLRANMESWMIALVECMGCVEAVLDFSDESIGDSEASAVSSRLRSLHASMGDVLGRSEAMAAMILDGVRVAVVGKPNAGKSSLVNAVSMRDVSITSPIPGTTRDVMEVACSIGGLRHRVLVADTAGLRTGYGAGPHAVDRVEAEGMKRAMRVAGQSQVVVLVLDLEDAIDELSGSASSGALDERIDGWWEETLPGSQLLPGASRITVFNKTDAVKAERLRALHEAIGQRGTMPIAFVSCVSGDGIDTFIRRLTGVVDELTSLECGCPDAGTGGTTGPMLISQRQQSCVRSSMLSIERAIDANEDGRFEIAAEHLRDAAREMSCITGDVQTEDVLEQIFSSFCIGK